MRRSLSRTALRLAAAVLVAGLALPAFGQTAPVRESGAERCARAKAQFVREHPEILQPHVLVAGEENYDVVYYDLDGRMQTSSLPRKIFGVLTMRARVVSPTLTQAVMELKATMALTEVLAGGLPATYTFSLGVLTINLDRTYNQGEIFEVRVSYNGNVQGTSLSMTQRTGGMVIWSLSEPFGAHTWWPCKDTPEDKADSVDLHWNVPDTHVAASNGTLRSVTIPEPGRKTYHWHESYPIATYLVSIAAYPYTVYSDWYHYSPTDSMEVRFHVYPDHYAQLVPLNALIVPMIEAYVPYFGEYPFLREKYGHAEFEWGGGMEHQTCTSLGAWDEWILVHELAHMWWGDMITCNTFHHIWLNEGFATYGEALWGEHTYGWAGYQQQMAGTAYYGPGTIYVEDPQHDDIFDVNLSYNKASWVPHMLRHVLGDSVFFDCLHAYHNDPSMQYGTATTEQFRDLCEAVSGQDLHRFFQQWIYEEYYPSYRYEWSAAPNQVAGYDVSLAIDQVQTGSIFTMPIDVTVTTTAGETTLVVQNSQAHQEYVLAVNAEPTRVQLDKDNWILRFIQEPLPAPSFDRGILVVNGVDFDTYGSEITTCYQDSVFWGNHPFSFWETFPEGSWTYPANMPAPLGYGPVPPDTLKQFSAVVWVGNNYNGDLGPWVNSPILSYLENGGNVLLMTRMGQDFVNPLFQNYLGITWRDGSQVTLGNCVASYPGLVNVTYTGTQSYCAPFDTTLTRADSHILFKDTSGGSVPRGIGVWRQPAAGGTYRPGGGQFIYWAGRPYRMNHDQERANVQYILDHLFQEPYDPETSVADGGEGAALRYALAPNHPNPFHPSTTISFTLPAREEISLEVYDVAGRRVRRLASGPAAAGAHSVVWDGRDDQGRSVSPGVYFYRLAGPSFQATRKMVLTP